MTLAVASGRDPATNATIYEIESALVTRNRSWLARASKNDDIFCAGEWDVINPHLNQSINK